MLRWWLPSGIKLYIVPGLIEGRVTVKCRSRRGNPVRGTCSIEIGVDVLPHFKVVRAECAMAAVFSPSIQITLFSERPTAARAQTAASVSPSLHLVSLTSSTRSRRSILALDGGGISPGARAATGAGVYGYGVESSCWRYSKTVKLECGVHRVSVVIRKHLSTDLKPNSHGKELELHGAPVCSMCFKTRVYNLKRIFSSHRIAKRFKLLFMSPESEYALMQQPLRTFQSLLIYSPRAHARCFLLVLVLT